MSKINRWLMDLEEVAVDGYMKGLRGEELKKYIIDSAVHYDAAYVQKLEKDGVDY